MLTIYDGRAHFWQWDTGQKLKVDAGRACEVHFRDPDGKTALVVETYKLDEQTVADVPNIILQGDSSVLAWVYICEGDECTRHEASFPVWPRQKPAGYVYTETEIKQYSNLDRRLSGVEKKCETLPTVSKEDAGKLLYIDATGNMMPLVLGDGLEIIEGVLRITAAITPETKIVFEDCGGGTVTMSGAEFAQQEDGSILIVGATITDNGDGIVLIS